MNAVMGSGAQPKNIVLFSDGTGNSSAKLFKTNVWRLYQAVDTAAAAPAGQPRQVVAYDDGVGTSSFKPLALLGGVFGVGLKRNVLELYEFVCRNYEPGDRIYAFGFSRGAFTIRVLVGLLTTVGIIDARGMDHAVLRALSDDAYRQFRRRFRLGGNRRPPGAPAEAGLDRTAPLVTLLRNFRERWIERKRRKAGLPTLGPQHDTLKPRVAFVGVWDTVAAYGSPVAEITKGIDRWVWPLSMPDYTLSDKVDVARHALALDDERDTFHPLLWDEVYERDLVSRGTVRPSRMRQVWFSGMHSDVGGGYPDDSLAYVSLVWMAEEAANAGLRLRAGTMSDFQAQADPFGPIHDSRAGLAAYYRYQPRKLSALLARPDRMTRIVQDPDFKGRGLLTEIRVHDSVLERIERGPDGYAPIVLPPRYCVEGGVQREQHAPRRAAAQESVWDLVWRRRVNYFLTLGLTFGLVALAVLPRFLPSPASTCIGPQCFISPWLRAVGNLLPSFATAWIESFADRPATFLVLALSIVWLLRSTRRIELSMRDTMRRLFRLSIRSPADAPGELRRIARAAGCIRRLRSSLRYQKSMQFLKWRAAPGVAAGIIYAVSCVLAVTFLSSILNMAHRGHLVWAERSEAFCRDSASADVPVVGDEAVFATSDMCWRVPGATVVEGERYRLRMDVEAPWSDGFEANSDTSNDAVRVRWRDALVQRLAARSGGPIAASPEGFDTRRFTWWTRWPATLLRRSTSDPWFRPLVHVEGHTRAPWAFQSVPMRLVDYGDRTYVGEFTAPATGTVVLSVNDAVLLWGGRRDLFYAGNRGTARVALEACNGDLDVPCDFADREN